jgi:SAM-dependent methyltransferase
VSAAIPSDSLAVLWHDLECGSYAEDHALWRALADECGDPVLEIGAGTGRIAIDLARHGHSVTALDNDAALLDALRSRSEGMDVDAVHADARSFELDRRYSLCIVPMQTIQLLGGPVGRAAFLRVARRHLVPDGVLAIALAEALEPYELPDGAPTPLPDMRELDGVVYASRPIAVREDRGGFVLERHREVVTTDGRRCVERNLIRLDRLRASQLERECRAGGFRRMGRRRVPANDEYAGSTVVMLRA